MKKLLDQINALTLKATVEISKKGAFKGLTEDDVDKIAESVEILNDLYEELYDKVFEK